MPARNKPTLETLMRTVTKDAGGCWLWTASVQSMGYGQIRVSGRMWLAHRLSWLIHYGADADGMLMHSCDTPRCVNPDHLSIGTAMDNHLDAVGKGRVDPMRLSTFTRKARRRVLTDEQVRGIRKDHRPLSEVAATYGVTVSCVSRIRTGKAKALVTD